MSAWDRPDGYDNVSRQQGLLAYFYFPLVEGGIFVKYFQAACGEVHSRRESVDRIELWAFGTGRILNTDREDGRCWVLDIKGT